MPFTPSHIAAILPFSRTPLPAAGLVIGSMVPDLPYFIPLGLPREYTHSLIGAVTADLPMGAAAFLVWVLLLRAPLLDLSPAWLRSRVRVRRNPQFRFRSALLLVAALAVGIATHLLWDSFTHPDGFVVLHSAAFRAQVGPFAISRWLQYLSSIFGLVVLAIWSVRWARRTAPKEMAHERSSVALRVTAWTAVSGVLVIVALAIWMHGIAGGVGVFDRGLVYRVAVYSMAAAGLLALMLCLGWYLLPRRSSAGSARSAA